jgi:hypothetical protein
MHETARVLVLTCFASSLVWAKPTGITGFSGLATRTCNNCHSGGIDPSLSLEGPEEVAVGDDVTFIVSIAGGAAQLGGLDVSAGDAGVELIPGEGMKTMNGELTHSAPGTFPSGGMLQYQFTVRARSEGPVTIFAAGLSADGNGLRTNDRAASNSRLLNVVPASHVSTDPLVDGVRVPPQGCSAAGLAHAPALLLALAALLARRRR